MALNIRDALKIRYNRRVHDDEARDYETAHVEIYNRTEQARIRALLSSAIAAVRRDGSRVDALDFGAGTGNLTRHLLELGAHVIAADVSGDSLRALESGLSRPGALSTAKLNGSDLSGFRDGQFDLVVTYSVMHHVPDYLRIVREFGRVVRPGGLVVIDTRVLSCLLEGERSLPGVPRGATASLRRHPSPSLARKARQSCVSRSLEAPLEQKFLGINGEGDIHVSPDDHIRWDLIREALDSCDVVSETDYLVCRERAEPPRLYDSYRDRCNNMRVGTYRRR